MSLTAARRQRLAATGDFSTRATESSADSVDALSPISAEQTKKIGSLEDDNSKDLKNCGARRGQTPLEDRYQSEGFMALNVPQPQAQQFSYKDARVMLDRSKKQLAGKGGHIADLLNMVEGNGKPLNEEAKKEAEGIGGKRRSNRKTKTEIKLEKFHGLSRREAHTEIEHEIKNISRESGPPDKVGEWALRNLVGQIGQQTREQRGFSPGMDLFDQFKVVLEVGDELQERKKCTRGKYERIRVALNANAVFTKAANEMRSVSAADAEIFERHNLKEVVKDVYVRHFKEDMSNDDPNGKFVEGLSDSFMVDEKVLSGREALINEGNPLDGIELIISALHEYHEMCGHEWFGDKKKRKETKYFHKMKDGNDNESESESKLRHALPRRIPDPKSAVRAGQQRVSLPTIQERYGRENIAEKWNKGPTRLAPAFDDEFDTSQLTANANIKWVEHGGVTLGGIRSGHRTASTASSSRMKSSGKVARARLQRKNLPNGRARQIRKHTEQLMRSMSTPAPCYQNLTTERRQAAIAQTANDGVCTSSMVAVAEAAPEPSEDNFTEGVSDFKCDVDNTSPRVDVFASSVKASGVRVTESREAVHRKVSRERRDPQKQGVHQGREIAYFMRMQEVWRCLSVPSWLRLETRIQISGSAAGREVRQMQGSRIPARQNSSISRQSSEKLSSSTTYLSADMGEQLTSIKNIVEFWETVADMIHSFTLLRASAIDYLLGDNDPEERVNPNYVPEKIIVLMVHIDAYQTPDPFEPMLLYLATLIQNLSDKALDILDDLDIRIRESCGDATATTNDLDAFMSTLRSSLDDMGLNDRLKTAYEDGLQKGLLSKQAAVAAKVEGARRMRKS